MFDLPTQEENYRFQLRFEAKVCASVEEAIRQKDAWSNTAALIHNRAPEDGALKKDPLWAPQRRPSPPFRGRKLRGKCRNSSDRLESLSDAAIWAARIRRH